MSRKKWLKPSVILPVAIGLIIGAVLFAWGMAADAPSLCLAGVAVAFLLVVLGACNAGLFSKIQLAYILPLCFGAGVLATTVILGFDGEFEEIPALLFAGLGLGAVLVCVGVIRLIKKRR